MENLLGVWAANDSSSAGKWLATLPAGASREAAVTAYVSQLANPLPELAAAWAETLTDETARLAQLESVARSWLEADRAAAEAWLAKVNLPAERKKELLAGR